MSKRNLRKGFTLIELLVVIAIIGILSAVVLASLNTARAKAADGAIRGNINGVRTQAELYYDSNSYKYATASVTTCTSASSMFTDTNITNAISQAALQSGTSAVCVASTTGYAIAVRLKSDNANAYCVDSSGNATTTAWGNVDATAELEDPGACL